MKTPAVVVTVGIAGVTAIGSTIVTTIPDNFIFIFFVVLISSVVSPIGGGGSSGSSQVVLMAVVFNTQVVVAVRHGSGVDSSLFIDVDKSRNPVKPKTCMDENLLISGSNVHWFNGFEEVCTRRRCTWAIG